MTPTNDKTLHVLVSLPNGFAGQGGIDRIMRALHEELKRQNRPDLDARFEVTRGPGSILLSPLYVVGFCLRMLVAKILGRIDLVHINLSSHGSTSRKILIAAWARLLGIPYLVHLHGSRFQTYWTEASPGLKGRIRKLFERAARTVVLGRVWQEFVETSVPGAVGRVVVLPNATEVPSLPRMPDGEHVHILFLGRLGDRKGVPELVTALGRMADLKAWRATIAGDGEVEATRERVAALGLGDRVQLPGWVDAQAVAKLIASADILVLPSHAENLPMSVIEGMAAGLAVVATPVGAVSDIIVDGETGLLVTPGDVDGLTDALRKLVEDPDLRARLGAAAMRMHRERLDLAPYAKAMAKIWYEAAGRAEPIAGPARPAGRYPERRDRSEELG